MPGGSGFGSLPSGAQTGWYVPSASRPPVVGIRVGVARSQVELAVVERAVDEAALEHAERQRRRHVRAAIVDRDDALARVGEEDVQVAERGAAIAPAGSSAAGSAGRNGASAAPIAVSPAGIGAIVGVAAVVTR